MSDPDQIIADRAQRRREGPLNLDRLAVSGAIEEMPEKPWRWTGPIILGLSLVLWAILIYGALLMTGVD